MWRLFGKQCWRSFLPRPLKVIKSTFISASLSFSFLCPPCCATPTIHLFFFFFIPNSNLPRIYLDDRFSPRSGFFSFCAFSSNPSPPASKYTAPSNCEHPRGATTFTSPEALVTTPASIYLKRRVALRLAVPSLVCAVISTHPLGYLEFLRDGSGMGPGPFRPEPPPWSTSLTSALHPILSPCTGASAVSRLTRCWVFLLANASALSASATPFFHQPAHPCRIPLLAPIPRNS